MLAREWNSISFSFERTVCDFSCSPGACSGFGLLRFQPRFFAVRYRRILPMRLFLRYLLIVRYISRI